MMDVISITQDMYSRKVYYKNPKSEPEFIKVNLPITDNVIEDYFDIIDWEQFDIRILFNAPLELVKQVVYEERIANKKIISYLSDYFMNHPYDKGGITLMMESLRCFREKGNKNRLILEDIEHFISFNSTKKEFSSVVFKALVIIKTIYGNKYVSSMMNIVYKNAKNGGNITLTKMIEGDFSGLLDVPTYEIMQEFEARIAEELVTQARECREIEEENERIIAENYEILENNNNINVKRFWKVTGIMFLCYCIAIPSVVSSMVYFIYGTKFNDLLITFFAVKVVGALLYTFMGGLIFKFDDTIKDEKVDYIKRLYKLWACIGILTGLIKLIIDILT